MRAGRREPPRAKKKKKTPATGFESPPSGLLSKGNRLIGGVSLAAALKLQGVFFFFGCRLPATSQWRTNGKQDRRPGPSEAQAARNILGRRQAGVIVPVCSELSGRPGGSRDSARRKACVVGPHPDRRMP